jgi:hypothetical protein
MSNKCASGTVNFSLFLFIRNLFCGWKNSKTSQDPHDYFRNIVDQALLAKNEVQIPIPDGASSVSYAVELLAQQTAHPGRIIRISEVHPLYDVTEDRLGYAGLDEVNEVIMFIGNKTPGQSHVVMVVFEVWTS